LIAGPDQDLVDAVEDHRANPTPCLRMKKARLRAIVSHSLARASACLLTYWLTTHAISRVRALSEADDLLGGLWAVLATLVVYRESHPQSSGAAFPRARQP
jgi:hypothetical protein